jgi:hypothetical protein
MLGYAYQFYLLSFKYNFILDYLIKYYIHNNFYSLTY